MKKLYTGVNIQWPISTLIVEGRKSIETRTYPLPEKYINKELIIIETPGKKGKFKARIIGTIIFGIPYKYKNKKEFYVDFDKHFVDKDSEWAWKDKDKWAWPILSVKPLLEPKLLKKQKGIVFTSNIEF